MGENIALLYMSAYFAQPAPEGSKNRFLRTQTNEAAVSALWKDPASRPDKIVALCSDTVRTKPTVPAADGSGNKVPTLEYFRDEFLKQLGVQPEQLVAVSVPDSMEEADQTRAISAVLEQVAENDNLYCGCQILLCFSQSRHTEQSVSVRLSLVLGQAEVYGKGPCLMEQSSAAEMVVEHFCFIYAFSFSVVPVEKNASTAVIRSIRLYRPVLSRTTELLPLSSE